MIFSTVTFNLWPLQFLSLFSRSTVTMATRGLVLLVLVAALSEAAKKQGNVDFIGEWNFPSLPSLSKQIHNFISGKSSTQYLQRVNDKPKASLSSRQRGRQFSPSQPPVPPPAPSFSIHGNSQYLDYPKSQNLKIVPRVRARERIFIRSQLNPTSTQQMARPQRAQAKLVHPQYQRPPKPRANRNHRPSTSRVGQARGPSHNPPTVPSSPTFAYTVPPVHQAPPQHQRQHPVNRNRNQGMI